MIHRAETVVLCGACGASRRSDHRYCGECGADLPAIDRLAVGPAPVAAPASAPLPAARAPSLLPGILRLALLAGVVAGLVALWRSTVGGDVPGFQSVLDFKIALATLVLVLAVVQPLAASLFYGWLRLPGISGDAAAFIHRWNGRALVLLAALVAAYCVRDIGPQSSPTRVAIHSALGGAVVVVLVAKLVILRAVPRLHPLLPVLGILLALIFAGLWSTSALYMLRDRVHDPVGVSGGALVATGADRPITLLRGETL